MATGVPATPGLPSPGGDAPTTDFALLEAQKENIRPLASGRSAATLGTLFDKESDETRRALEEQVEQFKRDIEEAERRDREGEDMVDGVQDVLDVWSRYVAFMVQHNPSAPMRIIPIVESATRRFIDDARYSQDIRYVKLWIMYSRQVERREDVWQFLESRDVCTHHAAFYEEWALTLEGLGRKKADEVYRLGIARKAAPLERLKNRHAAFLTRIMATSSGDIPDDDPSPPPPRPQRAVLGSVGVPLSQSQRTPSGSRSRGPNGSKMAVFSDSGARNDPEPTPWDDLGTVDGRRKENTVDAVPWRGETMPQSASRHRVAPRTPKIEVFKEDGGSRGAVVAAADVIRAKGSMNEAEMLRCDPLRNFDTSAMSGDGESSVTPAEPTASRKPSPSATADKPAQKRKEGKERKEAEKTKAYVREPWVCPTGGAETRNPKGNIERRMFDWDAVFKGGEEHSFEEVRARQRGVFGKQWKPVADWERSWHAGGSTSPKAAPKPAARPPSPTVNTKLANAEVMSLFNQTIHGGKLQRSDSDSDDDDEDDDDDEAADAVQALPTPLPRPRNEIAMMTPGGMVPPTPTPASGRGLPMMATPNIFADENAKSARKIQVFSDENAPNDENAGASVKRRNVFSETPAKQPLGAKTPLGPTPRAFAVFDENDPSATPAPSAPVQRNIFAMQETITEEDESSPRSGSRNPTPRSQAKPAPSPRPIEQVYEEAAPQHEGNDENTHAASEVEEQAPAPAEYDGPDYHAERYYDYQEECADENQGPMRRIPYNRQLLTPVTERTFEQTMTTTARSSRHASAFTVHEECDEEDEAFVASGRVSVSSRLSSAQAQSRRSSLTAARDFDNSGFVDTGAFGVPEGYTIARKLDQTTDMMNTLVVDDKVEARTEPEALTEPETAPEITKHKHDDSNNHSTHSTHTNDDFVTAAYGDTKVIEPVKAEDNVMSPKFVSEKVASSKADSPVSRQSLPGSFPAASPKAPPAEPVAPSATIPSELPAAQPPTLAPKSSDLPNPCNPCDEAVIATLLSRVDPPVEANPLVHRYEVKSGRLAALQRHAKVHARRSSTASTRQSMSPEEVFSLELAGRTFEVGQKLGEGAFGAVFFALDRTLQDQLDAEDDGASDDEDEDKNKDDAANLAIKVEKPASVWEMVILSRVHERIAPSLTPSIVHPRGLHAFADESFLLLEYSKQGSLLDVVNKASIWGIASLNGPAVPEEMVAIFFAIELLKLVEGLHTAGFIHGDLKIDNCLVRLDESSKWNAQYDPAGGNGWSAKGVRLIDFGRSSDLSLFSPCDKQTFVADWKVDARDCVEMREGRPWSFEADYFGLASICYCLLYGKYIGTETVETPEGRHCKIDAPMKRYWQADLWTKLFDTLLNPHVLGELPITNRLADIRHEFEEWLAENCCKNGKNLKQMLRRIEARALEV